MFYDELYKPVKNILTTGYGSTTKFGVKTRPNVDLRLEANAERKEDQSIDASLGWTQTFANRGILYSVGGKLDVNGTVDLNANATGVAKGVDVGAEAKLFTDKTHKDNKVGVKGTYRHELVSVKAGVEKKLNEDKYLLTASAVTDYEGISAGVEGKFKAYPLPKDVSKDLLEEVNFGLRYSTTNFHIISQFANFEKINIGVAQNINSQLALAGEFSHDLKPNKETNVIGKPVWTFGGNYVIDGDSSVSAKVNTQSQINAAYKVRVNPNINATISFESNVNKLDEKSKVGLSFDITA